MPRKSKKRPKKRKFKTVTFKLTERQKKSLDKHSKARNTTPIKLIKRSIATFTSLQDEISPPKGQTTENQLDLFIEAQAIEDLEEKQVNDGNLVAASFEGIADGQEKT